MIKKFEIYLKESYSDKIPIGVEVMCLPGKQDEHRVGGWVGVVKGYYQDGGGTLNGKEKRGFMYHLIFKDRVVKEYYVFEELVKPLDPQFLEKLLKRKEEIKLLHQHHDPYGEEDWEYESNVFESKNYSKRTKFLKYNEQLNSFKHNLENCVISYEDLNESIEICANLIGLGFKIYNQERILQGDPFGKTYVRDYNREFDFQRTNKKKEDFIEDINSKGICEYIGNNYDKHYTYNEFMKLFKGKKIIKLENPDSDPYGEEDWGYKFESKLNEYEIEDRFECLSSIVFFKVGDIGELVEIENIRHENIILYNVMNVETGQICPMIKKVLDEAFKKIGKAKRLYTPEDPYGEEDWGY